LPSLVDSLSFEQQLDLLANQLSGNHGVQLTYQHGHWTVFIGLIEILHDDGASDTINEEDIPVAPNQEQAIRNLLSRLIEVPINSAVFRVFAPDSWQVPEPQSVTRFDGTKFVPVDENSRIWSFPRGFREVPIHTR
jgi:hypothetical protein